MLNFKEIQELIKLVDKSHLTEVKIKEGEFEIAIKTDRYVSNKGMAVPAPTLIAASPSAMMPLSAPAAMPAATTEARPAAPEAKPAAAPTSATDTQYLTIKAPMVGTFYRSAGPDKPPYLKVGDSINVGTVVCIIEAMKLFNEIESDVAGKVVKVMIDDASPVEYDQVLFLIDPKG